MNLNIFVSNKCFIYCKGCYSYSREENCSSILSIEIICNFLKFAYNYGVETVTLCGGDPLARDDIILLIKRIKELGFKISIDTIGTPLIRDVTIGGKTIKKLDIKEIARYVDEIGIPIDGSNSEIFRLFRPTNDDILKDQVSICRELEKNKVKTCINTVAHKGNLNNAEELAKLINELDGVSKWQIFQFAPLGRVGFLNRKMFEISEEEFDAFENNVLNVLENSSKTLEFKKCKDRVKHYMLIDNSGNAWVPEFERIITNNNFSSLSDRLIIGNINNINDWSNICEFLKSNIKQKNRGR